MAHAPNTTDVVSNFVASCRKQGVKPGFYYSLGSNHYASDKLKLTDEQFNELVLAQTAELWSNYGDLDEIWWVVSASVRVPGGVVMVCSVALSRAKRHSRVGRGKCTGLTVGTTKKSLAI